jgi:hypothetical protein
MSISEKLVTIAENEQKVFEAGKKTAYDEFWDSYQDYGKRTDYDNMFSGNGWNNFTFNPKYDINAQSAYMILRDIKFAGDFAAFLESKGITFDTSRAASMMYAFSAMSNVTRIGIVSLEGLSYYGNTAEMFSGSAKLETIDLIIPHPTYKIPFTFFTGCNALKNIRIGGTIRGNVNMQQCPLTLESAKDIILHLENLRDNNDYAYTCSFSPDTWALLDADIGFDTNGDGSNYVPWRDYVEVIICWNT